MMNWAVSEPWGMKLLDSAVPYIINSCVVMSVKIAQQASVCPNANADI